MEKKKLKVAILTSGGDCQPMNNLVANLILKILTRDWEPVIIKNGFYGLVKGSFLMPPHVSEVFARTIINTGGSKIHCSRYPKFKEINERKKAREILKQHKIDKLIVIGGEGSLAGADELRKLTTTDIIFIPATIDNDISGTDTTLGFDSALNVVVEAVDRLRTTALSHKRCFVFEVMGRYCGDLAEYAGKATGCEVISTSEKALSVSEIISEVKKKVSLIKQGLIVIVSEHLYNVKELAKEIKEKAKVETGCQVLGYSQRGGVPSALDRYHAFYFAEKAIEAVNFKGSFAIVFTKGVYCKISLKKIADENSEN